MQTPAEMKRELVRRMNVKDLPGTMELIADDAVYFWSNGAALFGKAAIAEAMRANFDGIQNDTYETLDVTWLIDTPDVAVCVFRFRWKGSRCSGVLRATGYAALPRLDRGTRQVASGRRSISGDS